MTYYQPSEEEKELYRARREALSVATDLGYDKSYKVRIMKATSVYHITRILTEARKHMRD